MQMMFYQKGILDIPGEIMNHNILEFVHEVDVFDENLVEVITIVGMILLGMVMVQVVL